jgi:membrane-associated protein
MLLITLWDNLLKFFSTESLIRDGGLLLVFLFVFGQTGLFFCFFLPSGGLMFTTGVLTASGLLKYNIIWVCAFLTLAALLGNITGYWFGRKTGPLLYKKNDSKFFRQQHLNAAKEFFSKHGGLASAGALFFPILRTFAPIVAGMVKMNFTRFVVFAFTGSLVWVTGFVLTGYFIASIPALKKYISYIVILIIVMVTIPVIIGIIKKLNKGVGG